MVKSEGVITSFFEIGENKIELVSHTNSDSPIYKFLEKNKEGMHHISFDVDDIYSEMKRLKKEGIRLLNESPKKKERITNGFVFYIRKIQMEFLLNYVRKHARNFFIIF